MQTVDSSVVGGGLGTNAQSPLMAVKIDVSGQGTFGLTPLDVNTTSFVLSFSGGAITSGAGKYCALYSADGSDLGSLLIPAGPSPIAIPITMGAYAVGDLGTPAISGLTIPAGTNAVVTLKCTTTNGGVGSSVSAQFTAMTWSDGTIGNSNITTDGGLLLNKFPISGPTFNGS